MSVVNIIQNVVDEICDKYCKFPDEYYKKYPDNEDEAEEKLYCEKCDNCVLNKLI
ncbi:MAG: hypothetical protein IJD36_02315 [Clostridia bacterium]|nr:hypothetical protein [Clostridia bacterium]